MTCIRSHGFNLVFDGNNKGLNSEVLFSTTICEGRLKIQEVEPYKNQEVVCPPIFIINITVQGIPSICTAGPKGTFHQENKTKKGSRDFLENENGIVQF